MANPFKEAEKARKKAPGSKQEPAEKKEAVVVEETPVEPEKPVEVSQKPVAEKKEAEPAKKTEKKPAATKATADIFAGLAAEKPSGKTYAFYLTDENVDKLKQKASKMNISASKLLDHILSEVL